MIGTARLRKAWAAFRCDRRGVSALEFALIAPLMVSMYLGMSELSTALMSQQRTSHSASAVGDLAAQYSTLKSTDLTNIWAASTLVMQPFSATTLQLRLTSITQQPNGKATVDWSQVSPGSTITAYSNGTVMTTLPAGLLVNSGDTIVMSEAKYAYTSPVVYLLPSGLNFADTFYFRPRSGSTITCCS